MPQPRKLHDRYFKQAKAEGYAARSAYKLLEINEKKRLVRPGDKVLDLGCSPGSWLQVAEKIVGPRGVVVGVDLQPVALRFSGTVRVLQADAFTIDPRELTSLAGGMFTVVLSDMAPSTSGHGDDFLSVRLCRRVLELLPDVLATGGALAMKVLEGEEFPQLLREVRQLFVSSGATKPAASRDASREIFIVGQGYAPPLGSSCHLPRRG
jgi:23S rRNA (uridine2552-2'-O)-methyltransferase